MVDDEETTFEMSQSKPYLMQHKQGIDVLLPRRNMQQLPL
jgi:hypothetical protein